MTDQVGFISETKTVTEALVQMNQTHQQQLIIGRADNWLGIVTAGDFAGAGKLNLPQDLTKPLAAVALSPVVTISATAQAEEARNVMRSQAISCLPVVDNDRIIGLIRISDILNKFYAQVEQLHDTYVEGLNQLRDGVCLVDTHGEVLAANPPIRQALRLAGCTSQVTGKDFFPLAILHKTLHTQEPIQDVIDCPIKGRVVAVSASPIYLNNRLVGAISSNRDVTEQMEISHELQDAKQRLNVLQTKLNNFTAKGHHLTEVIGQGPEIRQAIAQAEAVALTERPVYITGPSGAGKEFLARSIHHTGQRTGLFIVINCANLHQSVLEGNHVGYNARAFLHFLNRCQDETMQMAHHGTVFLDHVGQLPSELQAKLFHVLSQHQDEVCCRVISACTDDLADLVRSKRFHAGLYQILSDTVIRLPAIKDTPDDVERLVRQFLKEAAQAKNVPVYPIEPEVMARLRAYHWPGNVREVRNVVEQMVLFAKDRFTIDILPGRIANNEIRLGPQTKGLYPTAEQVEAGLIEQALIKARGNKSDCAKLLGISRPTLYYKLEKYRISYPVEK